MVGRSFQLREAVISEDYAAADYAVSNLVQLGVRSGLAVPLMLGDRALGVLAVGYFEPRTFGDDQVDFLSLFSAQVGPALEAARLYEEAEHGRRQAEALADLGRQIASSLDLDTVLEAIATAARTLLSADVAALALKSGDTVQFAAVAGDAQARLRSISLPAGIGAAGWVANTGEAYRTADYGAATEFAHHAEIDARVANRNPVALLAVPIGRAEVMGVLVVTKRERGEFTESDQLLLERLAMRAAAAIFNARVLASEREAREEVQALLAATASLGTQAEPEAALRTLVEQAAKLIAAERATYAVLREGKLTIPGYWLNDQWIEDEHLAAGGGITRRVWDTGRPYRSNDLKAARTQTRACHTGMSSTRS